MLDDGEERGKKGTATVMGAGGGLGDGEEGQKKGEQREGHNWGRKGPKGEWGG